LAPIKANVCSECAAVLQKAARHKRANNAPENEVESLLETEAAEDGEEEDNGEEPGSDSVACPKAPRFLRFRDWGKLPSSLPKLNTLERLVLQRAVVFHTTFQLTSSGSRALKGTTIAFPHDGFDSLNLMLNGRDLARFVTVVVLAPPGMGKYAKLATRDHLLLEVAHVRAWAAFLVRHHPSYKQFAGMNFADTMARRAAELRAALLENVTVVEDPVAVGIAVQAVDDVARQTAHVDPEPSTAHMAWRSVLLRSPAGAQSGNDGGDLFHGLDARIGLGAEAQSASRSSPPPESVVEAPAAAAADGGDQEPRIRVNVGPEPINEYENVAGKIQDAFPDLFPLGLTSDMIGGKADLSLMVIRLLLFNTDTRWATSADFIMLLTDMYLRHNVARAASVEVARGSAKVKALLALVNQPEFRTKLAAAKSDPRSGEAQKLKGILLPLVRQINRRQTWTQMERQDALSELYAMYNAYGSTMVYYTFNPRLLDDPLSVRFAARDTTLFTEESKDGERAVSVPPGYDWGKHRGFPDYEARAKLLQQNPVEGARGFDRIARAVVELLLGLTLRDGQPGRGATHSHFASQEPRGIFLRSKALYG
jgi:hypothetical protein